MKNFLLLAAALLLAVTGCDHRSDSQKLADYQESSKKFEQTYMTEMTKIEQDSTLTPEQKAAAEEAYDKKATAENVAEAVKVIKKNPSAPVAVAALKNVYYNMEIPELEKTLGYLKGDNLKDEFVVKVKSGLESKKATAEGKKFTDFTIVQDESDPAGSTARLSDFVGKGKYILVDFWASWCGPCRREIPNIAAVYQKYKGDKFDVLSVAVWDKPADTKAAAAENGVVWNQIINAQRIPTDLYGIDGIPHIILFGPDGTIVKRDLRGDAIEKAVAEALGR